MQFTKLFSSILDSTIWQEPAETKIVWITMLAMVDRNGEVHASIPGLAKRAGVTLQQCEQALECLLSPDPYSRTTDHEGRRIAQIDGGWELLNHKKYRELLSKEERREYNRRKQAEYRAQKNVKSESANVKHVNDMSAMSTHTDADTDADSNTDKKKRSIGKRTTFIKPTPQEVRDYSKSIGFVIDGDYFCDFYEQKGWKIGKSQSPMKCWKASVRTWKANQNQNPTSIPTHRQQKASNEYPEEEITEEMIAKITLKPH